MYMNGERESIYIYIGKYIVCKILVVVWLLQASFGAILFDNFAFLEMIKQVVALNKA